MTDMMPRERFVHFVSVFSPDAQRLGFVEEAYRLPLWLLEAEYTDDQGDFVSPVLYRPMEAAWEFVQYRRFGAPRPIWLPRVLSPEATPILSL